MGKRHKVILVSVLVITAILVCAIAISINTSTKNVSEEDILGIAKKVSGKYELLKDQMITKHLLKRLL